MATTPTPDWMNDQSFAGMDPNLRQIYQQGNLTPAGRGTGFADWQYWQGVGPSQYSRLTSDIAGTGTDQPTGTPGVGPWQQSGSAQTSAASPMNASSQADQILAQVEGNMNGLIQQLLGQDQGAVKA